MDAVLERAALADQKQPPARSFALLALREARQPDRRHQLPVRELGQHPRIDLVGLARQRRQPLDLLRVGYLDLPAAALQRVMHKPGAIHRLDRRLPPPRPMPQLDAAREPAQTVSVRRRRAHLDALAPLIEQAVIHPLTAQIQSNVQHEAGPPSALAPGITRRSVPPAGGPPSSHSVVSTWLPICPRICPRPWDLLYRDSR